MITVMMRVEQDVDAVILRPLVQSVETDLRRVHELCVDDGDAAGVDQITDRAAAAEEVADVVANRVEGCLWRRLLLLLPKKKSWWSARIRGLSVIRICPKTRQNPGLKRRPA